MSSTAPSEPTAPEIEGSELPDVQSVPVVVTAPVRTQELPGRSGIMASTPDVGTSPIQILHADPRRKSAWILGNDDDIFVGRTQQECAKTGALWPVEVPLPIDHDEDVWVAAATSTTRVSYLQNLWTD